MIFSATSGKDSLSNISVFQKIGDPNVIGGRYLKVKGSNQVITLTAILTSPPETRAVGVVYGTEKYANKEPLVEADLLPDVVHPDGASKGYTNNLLDLINNGTLESDKEIRIKYEDKTVIIEPALYHMLGSKDEVGAQQEYYVTAKKTLLEKEKITPPAFKREDAFGTSIFKDDFSLDMYKSGSKYYRDVKAKFKYNGSTKNIDATLKINGVSKSIEGVASVKGKAKSLIRNVTKTAEKKYTVYNDDGVTEDYRIFADGNVVTLSKQVGGETVEYSFVEGSSRTPNDIPVKSLNFNFNKAGKNRGSFEFNIEIDNLDNVIVDDDKIVGFITASGKKVKLSDFPFKVNLESAVTFPIDKRKLQAYKASRIFEKNSAGESEVVADVIQIGPVNEKGECVVYDYQERNRVFERFEKNIQKCKQIAKSKAPSAEDLVILATLQKEIDDQLSTLGDLEAAREIEEKRRVLEEEKAKTGADRDATKIEDAQKAYDEAISKIGYYKDKKNLADIDTLIARYQQGEFFPTFFIDENGNKVEINSGDITNISSNLPYDWSSSKTISSLIGKDKITFDKKTGKAKVEFNSTAKEITVASLKTAGLLLNLSFSAGPFGLLVLPLALPAAVAGVAASAVVGAGELIRSKVKQSKLNRMKPNELKEQQNIDLQFEVQKEFEKATMQYYEDLKAAKRTFKTEDEYNNAAAQAKEDLKNRRKAIFSQYMLAAPGTINSKFNAKDKKITNENIYGFLEYRRRKKELIKGKNYKDDVTVMELLEETRKRCDQEIDDLKKDTGHLLLPKKLKADRIKQLKVERDDPKNTFLSEHGPLDERVDYLKKTLKYYVASEADRKKMEEECEKKNQDALKNLSVESVELEGYDDAKLEEIKQELLKVAEECRPTDLEDDTQFLLEGELKTKIEVRVDDKELKEPHNDPKVERIQPLVEEYVDLSEKCAEIVAGADPVEAAKEVADIYNEKETAERHLKDILTESLVTKVLEDKEMWVTDNVTPEPRLLEKLIFQLKTRPNIDERKILLTEKYNNMLAPKINEKIKNFKEKYRDDSFMLEVLSDKGIDVLKDNLISQGFNFSRYGVYHVYEQLYKFLVYAEREHDDEVQKKYLSKAYSEYKRKEDIKVQAQKEKEIKKRIKNVKKYLITLEKSELNDKTDVIGVIANYGKDPKLTEAEVENALKELERFVRGKKALAELKTDGGRHV